ncbi:MAG: RND transporter [Ruminococcus sp.]|nr:RND transporter [Ruminococcus sp.]
MGACVLPGCGKEEKKDEIVVPILEAKEIQYKTCKAEVRDISQKYYQDGYFGTPYRKSVKFKTNGMIKSIEVDSPSDVKEGDLLCTLYTDDLEEQIEQEEIRLEQVRGTVEKLKDADADANQILMAEYDVELEELRYQRLLDKFENYNVYAPCDGEFNMQFGRNPYTVNSQVYQGSVFGYTTDRTQQYLCVDVYDDPLTNVNFGTSVMLDQGAASSTGTVTDVVFNDNGDFSSYTYVITLDNEDELFDFGDIRVVFDIYSRLDTVVIPKKAIKELGGRKFVYLLIDGVKVEQDIETGIEDNNDIEVTAGLSGGEELILN